MKNYLTLLSDIEIKNFIKGYLESVGYDSFDKIDDIAIQKVNSHAKIAVYYSNDLEKVINNELNRKNSAPSFDLNSFEVFSYNLYPGEINSFMYLDSLNVDDDITTYWNFRMYEKFGKEYINDLRKYQLDDYDEISNLADKINCEYEKESNKILLENGLDF